MELRETESGYFFWYAICGDDEYISRSYDSPSSAYAARDENRIVWDCYSLTSGGGKL